MPEKKRKRKGTKVGKLTEFAKETFERIDEFLSYYEKVIWAVVAIAIAVFQLKYVSDEDIWWKTGSAWAPILIYLTYFFYGHLQDSIYRLVVPKRDSKKDKESHYLSGSVAFLLLLGLLCAISIFAFDYLGHKIGMQKLGTFGDFFGGVLNPILTFITVIGLAITFLLQRVQVRDGREQAAMSEKLTRQQVFETTFFNLLALHSSIVEQLHLDVNSIFGRRESNAYRIEVPETASGRLVFRSLLLKIQEETKASRPEVVSPSSVYASIQTNHDYLLGHFFRNFSQILRFIDESGPIDASSPWKTAERRKYADILRAQLSAHELILIFFNFEHTTGDDLTTKKLIIRYEMLEYMPVSFDEKTNILSTKIFDFRIEVTTFLSGKEGRYFNTGAFGENPSVADYFAANKAKLFPDDFEFSVDKRG